MKVVRRSEVPDPMPELKYLPLFYLFPQELLDQSEFWNFPRNPYTVLHSREWMAIYNSEKFVETLSDGLGRMVWKHFGIKASLESFSGYSPLWMLARHGMWVEIAAQRGANTYTLATASETYQFQPPTIKETNKIFASFVEEARKQYPLDAWIAAIKEVPAHEDYEPSRQSRASMEFYRKWYHSRAVTKVEFVGLNEDWDNKAGAGVSPWDMVDYRLDYDRFKSTLDATNQKVLQWMYRGYTQVEVAEALGFANHSPVSKRIKKIQNKYLEYNEINDTYSNKSHTERDSWTEMNDLLFPKRSSPKEGRTEE